MDFSLIKHSLPTILTILYWDVRKTKRKYLRKMTNDYDELKISYHMPDVNGGGGGRSIPKGTGAKS
jgi:hypothetical protein